MYVPLLGLSSDHKQSLAFPRTCETNNKSTLVLLFFYLYTLKMKVSNTSNEVLRERSRLYSYMIVLNSSTSLAEVI